MSNGFGAAFGGLTLLAVLAGFAALLTLSLLGVFVLRRRTDTVPGRLRYLPIALLIGVVLVAGFAAAALYDEAPPLAAVFVATVFVPLVAVGVYLHRTTALGRLDVLATVAFAWSIPFVVGLVVTSGLPTVPGGLFELSPAASRRTGIFWVGAGVGGSVVAGGAILLGKRVSESVFASTST